jgi:hypothetical protein
MDQLNLLLGGIPNVDALHGTWRQRLCRLGIVNETRSTKLLVNIIYAPGVFGVHVGRRSHLAVIAHPDIIAETRRESREWQANRRRRLIYGPV